MKVDYFGWLCCLVANNIVADHFSIVVSWDCWRQLRTVQGMHCKLIFQCIFRTADERKEGSDLK